MKLFITIIAVVLCGCTINRITGPVTWAPKAVQVISSVYCQDSLFEAQQGKTVSPKTEASIPAGVLP